jgi:hypothetical protein
MPEPKFDPQAWMDAAAPAMGFEIRGEYRAGILMHLGLTAKAAALVLEHPVDVHEEPGPVFRPGAPK